MATYLARPAEILLIAKQFAGMSEAELLEAFGHTGDKTLEPAQLDEMHGQFKREYQQLDEKTVQYGNARVQRLQDLVRAVDTILAGEASFQSCWDAPLKALDTDIDGSLGAIGSGLSEPSKQLLAVKYRLVTEETHFADTLFVKRPAERWAAMSKLHQDLMTFMGVLRTRWQVLLDKVREIDGQADARVEELWRPFRTAKDASADRARRITEALQRAVADLRRLKDASTGTGILDKIMASRAATSWIDATSQGVDAVIASIGDAMVREIGNDADDWQKIFENFQAQAGSLRSLRDAERDGIHRIFKDARREAEDFVQKPVPERARALDGEARTFLSDWGSNLLSDGARRDAQAVSDDIYEVTKRKLAMIDDLYREFESQNKGRFYGSLADDVVGALIVRERWRQRLQTSSDYRVLETVQTFRSLAERRYDVDLGAAFRELIDAASARPVPDDRASARSDLVGQLRDKWSTTDSKIEATLATYLSELDSVRRFVEASEFAELFRRSELESSLRS